MRGFDSPHAVFFNKRLGNARPVVRHCRQALGLHGCFLVVVSNSCLSLNQNDDFNVLYRPLEVLEVRRVAISLDCVE